MEKVFDEAGIWYRTTTNPDMSAAQPFVEQI